MRRAVIKLGCTRADLVLGVHEVHEDVEDLEEGSDDVDHDERLIRLQDAIIQPAQVAVET